jgi:lipopolysaccharide export system permease protein
MLRAALGSRGFSEDIACGAARSTPIDGVQVLGILRRQILKELVVTTAVGLVGISVVMTFTLTLIEASKRGMTPVSVLAVSPYIIPTLLPYTLPTCLLYACVWVFGGMAGANEITALKAAGVHLFRVIWPAVLFAVGVTAAALVLTDRVIPACNNRLQEVLISDLESAVLNYIKTNNNRLRGDRGEFEVAVRGVKGRKLLNPIIIGKNPHTGETEYNITARDAAVRVERVSAPRKPPQIMIRLTDAQVVTANQNYKMSMKNEELPLPIPLHLWSNAEPKLETLTYRGCWLRSLDYSARAAQMETEFAWQGAVALVNGKGLAPAEYVRDSMKYQREESRRLLRKSRDAIGEMHMRGNHSSAALAFALLGCPISILLARKDSLQTFFLCFAPIVTFYYPSLILALNVFKEGTDDFGFYFGQGLMWAPTVGLAVAALFSLHRLLRT